MMKYTVLCVAAFLAVATRASDMWDYVHTPDSHYSWYDTGATIEGDGYTGYVLNMTSQSWLSPQDSSRYIWTHQLVVCVPHNLSTNYETGLLYITGGGNDNPSVPSADDEDIVVASWFAVTSGTITASLFQIPNQPILFTDDPLQKERSEDAAVAFTWYEYMVKHQNKPEWVIYFPMVKAAVRAMDTMTTFAKSKTGVNLKTFMVAGASKRGFATWYTGAVDSRVVGIAPIVMDLLNMQPGLMHMWKAYGGWTFAFKDYYEMNVTKYLTTPLFSVLAKQIDPLMYKENLTMPKLVIDSTGDEFFMPDDDHYWWGDLPGETHRLMVANAEHSMATGIIELLAGGDAFYLSLLEKQQRPKVTWDILPDGTIHATANPKPDQVVMRFATTIGGTRRDFRLIKGDTKEDPCEFIPIHIFGDACVNPVLWVGEDLKMTQTEAGWEVKASQPLPPDGWRGFFLDYYFPGPSNTTYRLTTQVSIIPQTFPFPACSGDGCIGGLV